MSPSDRAEVEALAERIKALETERDAMKASLDTLRGMAVKEAFRRMSEGHATLSAADGGYSLVRADIGMLAMKIEDMAPYADGTKVTLSIGNPSNVTIRGLKTTIEWKDPDATETNSLAHESKVVTFSNDLRPGSWTKVDVVLPKVKPEQLSQLSFSDFSHGSISLLK